MYRALSLDSYGKVSPEEKRSREPIGTFPTSSRGRSNTREGSREVDGNVLSSDAGIVNEQSNESSVGEVKVGLSGASVDFFIFCR